MRSPKKILIVNLAGLGDIILSSLSLKAVRQKFSDSKICLLTFRSSESAVINCPYLDKILYVEKNLTLSTIKTLLVLRDYHFDVAINLYNIHSWAGAFKMWLLFLLVGAAQTYGRNTEGRGFFYDVQHKEEYPFKEHDTEVMLKTVEMLTGKADLVKDLELWVPEAQDEIADFFRKNGIQQEDKIICIHPGAVRKSHRWHWRYFADLSDQLAKSGFKIILTGNENEKRLVRRISSKMSQAAIVASGELSLGAFVGLLKKVRLFITNDTAPVHIANCLHIPMVVLSGNSPQAFLPYYGEGTTTLRKDALEKISVGEVVRAAESFLSPAKRLQPVKILHLHTRAIIGGSGANVLLTLKGLPSDQFSAHAAFGIQDRQPVLLDQIKAYAVVHTISHLINKINIFYDLFALFELVVLIKKEKYTIVHTHNSKVGILGRLAAKICRVPVIIHTIHSCEFNYSGIGFIRKRIYILAEKCAIFFTDHLIAISEHLKEEFLKYHIAGAEKISVIYSGIEIEKFRSNGNGQEKRKEFGFDEHDLIIGTVARLEQGKGHEEIIGAVPDVLKQAKNAKFLFVGDGPLRTRLEKMVQDKNLQDCIKFSGLRLDIGEILHMMDIFCFASDYEGMGRAVLEAQAAGKPVVAKAVGGIKNITQNNKTALLSTDQFSFSKALLKLISDPDLRSQMGKEAFKFVDERFAANKMAKDITVIYERFLND